MCWHLLAPVLDASGVMPNQIHMRLSGNAGSSSVGSMRRLWGSALYRIYLTVVPMYHKARLGDGSGMSLPQSCAGSES